METIRILVGVALVILLAWSIWRWWHADQPPRFEEAPPPDFLPTEPGDREQPMDSGGGPPPKSPP